MVTIHTIPSLPPSSQPSHTHPSQTPPSSQDLLIEDSRSIDSPMTIVTSTPSPIRHYSFLSPGPKAKPSTTKVSRDQTFKKSLPFIKELALPEVRDWVRQCKHCGQFGHSEFLCTKRDSPSVAEHHNDWRLVHFKRHGRTSVYSVLALYPSLAQPNFVQTKKTTDALPTGSVSNINPAVSSGSSTSNKVICCTCKECTCGCHNK
ncbi:uncharacterized protein MELLADRAFT_104320 [Melampsora larici-populina 98AG31]|uniref:Uncharacterized protein n=1 Tax=Melampsora larici-populina (strain 98AG31 / pathotype 3-4-7) TaxID=747676 RepID=F4REB3_MELLP|nr:uncharacterized protein MELLADRAFT_104320 [Melampsora larici-populina 98AG31]EGG09059.1 hypothetical protein MELLADRAFT_104320 [Melampsora larici-populina 98AG31]